ncbi:DUF4856 domain-containing protein [Fulvivirga sp. 29W222]|uniref:DUF4856 domain-containing protein n=1 Tax=Fulvivirga marina TaxID=2494733 RepID=A0A937G211_9BACT|nr:DUF4856 domain-containing protein [Fulvivirga marina]MBL6449227.1 DUF4856 domain-containing protein [Fulvivirga marina]
MKLKLLYSLLFVAALFSCDEDEDALPNVEVPATYEFTRDGQSTVSYQGQIDRLDMVAEIKSYLSTGNLGEAIEASKLLNMFANENNAFISAELNASSKQLEDKTFISDVQWFKNLFVGAEEASNSGISASNGQAGLLERGTGFILVNEKGWEFTQFVEKGLMGAVFYNQIYNSYLSDAKTGDDVDNETMVDGKNYTTMEHHWDEAFGYWGVPVDFPNGTPVLSESEDRFWAKYTLGRDALLGVSTTLMNAYLTGRAAIVAQRYEVKNEQKEIIYEAHELVAAATAVHYLNQAMSDLSAADHGNLFHHLSEGYAFVKALQYSPVKKITQAEINEILNTDLGIDGNFWEVKLAGIQKAKATLVATYPSLEAIKDQL